MKNLIKNVLNKNPFLYNLALKFTSGRMFKPSDAGKYQSRFGGCWIDRKDYKDILDRKLKSGEITSEEAGSIEEFVTKGYIVFQNALPASAVDGISKSLDKLKTEPDPNVKITGIFDGPKPYTPELVTRNNSVRVVDYFAFSDDAKRLLLADRVTRFLTIIFEQPPLVFQSLNFEYGSQQNIHQDTAYVVANEPMKLAAAWIALEDVTEGSGELIYYEGSHRLPEYLFSKYFKHFNKDRDGDHQHTEWQGLLHTNSQKANYPLRHFLPKKGDVLIWHADLAHGGAKITNDKTRKSLVGHYCPASTNPFYFSYLEDHKNKVKFQGGYYSSAYYKVG